MFKYSIDYEELIWRLVRAYDEDSRSVAWICDTVIDRSGHLLGVVRERHGKYKVEKSNFVQQTHAG